jgi:hypothetical protein
LHATPTNAIQATCNTGHLWVCCLRWMRTPLPNCMPATTLHSIARPMAILCGPLALIRWPPTLSTNSQPAAVPGRMAPLAILHYHITRYRVRSGRLVEVVHLDARKPTNPRIDASTGFWTHNNVMALSCAHQKILVAPSLCFLRVYLCAGRCDQVSRTLPHLT